MRAATQTGAERLVEAASRIQYDVAADNAMEAARGFGRLAHRASELAADIAQDAYDGGATKKDIAAAMGISPRDLVGLKRTT